MLSNICPRLPMRNNSRTKDYYQNQLDFILISDYGDYLIMEKDLIQIHFFLFEDLDPFNNYGQVYIRTDNIDDLFELSFSNEMLIRSYDHYKIREFSRVKRDDLICKWVDLTISIGLANLAVRKQRHL